MCPMVKIFDHVEAAMFETFQEASLSDGQNLVFFFFFYAQSLYSNVFDLFLLEKKKH